MIEIQIFHSFVLLFLVVVVLTDRSPWVLWSMARRRVGRSICKRRGHRWKPSLVSKGIWEWCFRCGTGRRPPEAT